MSDRFYTQQYDRTGWKPVWNNTWIQNKNRRKNMAWTEESKAQAVEMYQEQEPTPETSMEIVKDIADELGESPNGVRMILTKAGVYVRKTPAAKTSNAGGGGGGGRVSVSDAQASLTSALSDAGQEVDEAIISKLTGKAAVYFKGVVEALNS
jgi:transposase-like protein